MAVASENKTNGYTEDTLKLAVEDVREKKISLRKASLRYGIKHIISLC